MKVRTISYVALFAAFTVIGTMIKIPLPTGAFVHLGNAVLWLAVLLLGYRYGALAGGIGFMIFDILHGFVAEAPYFLIESFIVGGAMYLMICLFRGELTAHWQVLCVCLVAAVTKLGMTQLKNTSLLLYSGADLSAALIGASSKLVATGINVTLSVAIVTLLYFPLKKMMR